MLFEEPIDTQLVPSVAMDFPPLGNADAGRPVLSRLSTVAAQFTQFVPLPVGLTSLIDTADGRSSANPKFAQ
jgi:hypothetical protein